MLDEVDHVCGFEEDALTVSSITLKSWKEAIYSDRRGESSENSQLESNLGDEASWDFLKQREKLWNRCVETRWVENLSSFHFPFYLRGRSPKYSLHQQRLKDSILEMLLERQALIFGRADRNTKYETLVTQELFDKSVTLLTWLEDLSIVFSISFRGFAFYHNLI